MDIRAYCTGLLLAAASSLPLLLLATSVAAEEAGCKEEVESEAEPLSLAQGQRVMQTQR